MQKEEEFYTFDVYYTDEIVTELDEDINKKGFKEKLSKKKNTKNHARLLYRN